MSDVPSFFSRMWGHVTTSAAPTPFAIAVYCGFIAFQALLAIFVPGFEVHGLPVPSEGNVSLPYRCNGVPSWYITLITLAVLHVTHIFRLDQVLEHFGSLITVAMIFSDILAVLEYVSAIMMGKAVRMTGNVIYDFFMGAWLNPRFGKFDLKFWAETRVAWILLFVLTLSAAVTQFEKEGTVSPSMLFMVLAHFLYTNACMKGEECILTTWDIFYEKWGWMLIYWNFCGVPFVYCAQSLYILKQRVGIKTPFPVYYVPILVVVLLLAYYVWDTAQSQRNRWRMSLRNINIPRSAPPQFSFGTLKNPKYLESSAGKLLVDGWWKYARKIHYTADTIMALTWGLSCGFDHFLPYFYVCFFSGMIIHRYIRDASRCKRKYGKDWDKYCATVPYVFIPGII
uniref:Delta(24(24(1)))-sterol reductase n=1 Tax=Arcella intermedia TaxID=1963864 RepID=A0A6B2L5L0_9EUKA